MVNNSVLWLSKIKIMDEILPTLYQQGKLERKAVSKYYIIALVVVQRVLENCVVFWF
jgi:ribosomal protein L19E